ncbi:unnamed protein product [Lactuca saligna]|uniref:Uncharacterized protein n=1 Tax=Lactuca saligna TaxID=75948 RepID=A0AA36EAR4_LACSI|nr:unnamed protein product [Lactuca saligna]
MGILLPREAKKTKKSKKDEPTSPEKKAKGSTSSKSTKQKPLNVVVIVQATKVITTVVEESQENVVIPSKTGMFQRIKMKSKHKRKSSSQKLLRKPQLSHQGVMFREVPVPVSPASKKRAAEDMAKPLSQPKKKKMKKARKIVSSSESTEEDKRVPETPKVTSILTSSTPETSVIFTPEVSIAKSGMLKASKIVIMEKVDYSDQTNELRLTSQRYDFLGEVKDLRSVSKERHVLFVQEVKMVKEDVNLKIQELHEEMNKEIVSVQYDYASLRQKVDIICDAVTKFVKMYEGLSP